jgi:recombinational DNA repair protein RecT
MSQELIKKQIESEQMLQKFTQIFSAVQKVGKGDAEDMYRVESFHFMKELTEKGLQDVSPISAMGAFLDVVSNGLSFASSAKHVYLMTRNVNTAPKNEAPKWERRLVYSTSPDGKIYQAQRSGAIEYVTKPVIVYEGDEFAVGTNESGEQIIRHQVKFPRSSQKIVAGYVYVVFKGGKREPYWMDLNDIKRLAGYSAKQNKGTANALYGGESGQIDTGFFGAKLINFALKNVRKSGTASQFEVNGDAGDAAIITGATELPEPGETSQFEAAMVVEPVQNYRDTIPATTQTNTVSFTNPQRTPEPF